MKTAPPEENNNSYNENDDFFIDESLIRLLSILIPRLKWILLVSFLASLYVGIKLFFFTPRAHVCTAIVAPDVMRDLNSFDLVQLTSVDSDLMQLPFSSQLSQLKTLANSSQVKKRIIEENHLMEEWDCKNSRDCLIKLKEIYSVSEIRNVGLQLKAQYLHEETTQNIVQSAIDQTNKFYESSIIAKATKSIEDIHKWIDDVSSEIKLISDEYIRFASDNNITDLESQFSSGISLIGTIKGNKVNEESKLAELKEQYGEDSTELLPIKAKINQYQSILKDLLEGTEKDEVYPALANYESLKLKVREYQDRLQMLRSRAELFNKQLAAAQIESQKQIRSLMILDQPDIVPAAKGTVKFTLLTFIGIFFFMCIFFVMKEYWKTLKEFMNNAGKETKSTE